MRGILPVSAGDVFRREERYTISSGLTRRRTVQAVLFLCLVCKLFSRYNRSILFKIAVYRYLIYVHFVAYSYEYTSMADTLC